MAWALACALLFAWPLGDDAWGAARADRVGEWTTSPFPLPTYAIHAAMLPTGRVLFYSFPSRHDESGAHAGSHDESGPNAGLAFVWDPSRGTGKRAFTEVDPPRVDADGDGDTERAPIYCSGQSFLSDGRVLVTGGTSHDERDPGFTAPAGLDTAFTFDPWSEAWERHADMRQGRWYPSQVLLASGRTVVLGGYTEESPGGLINTDLEVFAPASGTFQHHESGDRSTEPYPRLFLIPGGDVLLAGPGAADSGVLDVESFTWRNPNPDEPTFPSQNRIGGGTVLRPQSWRGSSRVTQIGGWDWAQEGATKRATESTETIDVSRANPTWTNDLPLNVPRSYPNTVTLPDGSLAAIGGARGNNAEDGQWWVHSDGRGRRVELLAPGADRWRLGPPQAEDRAYHATAVLLPDGRVFSAGDEAHGQGSGAWPDTAEIYSPPYLFDGRRPKLGSVPKSVGYGDRFGVRAGDDVRKIVLMAPGATTHAMDMNQRRVPLDRIKLVRGAGLNVVSPPDATVAPPGYYMAFGLDSDGVPSVAKWIRVKPQAPDRPKLREPNESPPREALAP